MIKGIIFDYFRTLYDPETCQLEPGALAALQFLRANGFHLCLISGWGNGERHKQLDDLGLLPFFDDIQIIQGSKKFDHFKRCFRSMGLMPGAVMVIGDRVAKEIALGNRLKAVTVWYRRCKFVFEVPSREEEKPNYEITGWEQLPKLLSQINACP